MMLLRAFVALYTLAAVIIDDIGARRKT